jgi:hypothetical protein
MYLYFASERENADTNQTSLPTSTNKRIRRRMEGNGWIDAKTRLMFIL